MDLIKKKIKLFNEFTKLGQPYEISGGFWKCRGETVIGNIFTQRPNTLRELYQHSFNNFINSECLIFKNDYGRNYNWDTDP